MARPTAKDTLRTLHESGARYVVSAQGEPVAVLLTLQEYDRYLDLLDDEADSQDPMVARRLAQASARPSGHKRSSFREYAARREAVDAQVPH